MKPPRQEIPPCSTQVWSWLSNILSICLMSLLRMPVTLTAALAVQVSMTSPEPPPERTERVKPTGLEHLGTLPRTWWFAQQTCPNITTRHIQIMSHILNNGIFHVDIFKMVPLFKIYDRYASLYSGPFVSLLCWTLFCAKACLQFSWTELVDKFYSQRIPPGSLDEERERWPCSWCKNTEIASLQASQTIKMCTESWNR